MMSFDKKAEILSKFIGPDTLNPIRQAVCGRVIGRFGLFTSEAFIDSNYTPDVARIIADLLHQYAAGRYPGVDYGYKSEYDCDQIMLHLKHDIFGDNGWQLHESCYRIKEFYTSFQIALADNCTLAALEVDMPEPWRSYLFGLDQYYLFAAEQLLAALIISAREGEEDDYCCQVNHGDAGALTAEKMAQNLNHVLKIFLDSFGLADDFCRFGVEPAAWTQERPSDNYREIKTSVVRLVIDDAEIASLMKR